MLGRHEYHGFCFTIGDDGEKIAFAFEIIPIDPDENCKEGTTPPNTPHTLALLRSKGQSASSDHSTAYAQRVIGIVLRDLVDAMDLTIT